jgi:hypothetical protein
MEDDASDVHGVSENGHEDFLTAFPYGIYAHKPEARAKGVPK